MKKPDFEVVILTLADIQNKDYTNSILQDAPKEISDMIDEVES